MYPVSGKDSCIVDCCIIEVKYGNVVSYIKDNERYIVEASRIVKDGKSYDLLAYAPNPELEELEADTEMLNAEPGTYREHDYEYYQLKFKGATQQRGFGIFLTVTGLAANVTSIVLASDGKTENDGLGVALNVYGIIGFNIGLPLWISGGIKRANNRRAMKKAKAGSGSSQELRFGAIAHGVGLAFSF